MNQSLNKAKAARNDEFYTKYEDIEKELSHYTECFKNKIVYCNCDNPVKSEFYRYFQLHFQEFELKKLIFTYKEKEGKAYKYEIDKSNITKAELKENGDFRSDECIELLKGCDIVVSNPPFSLIREYIGQLNQHQKSFLCISNMNAVTYKEIFPLFMNGKIWLGYEKPKQFIRPDWTIQKFGNTCWLTNLPVDKSDKPLILTKRYYGSEDEYPFYDNYKAINVNRVKDIPIDYDGVIGVPITFLSQWNPEQFEVLGFTNTGETNEGIKHADFPHGRAVLNGKEVYTRILIRRKENYSRIFIQRI